MPDYTIPDSNTATASPPPPPFDKPAAPMADKIKVPADPMAEAMSFLEGELSVAAHRVAKGLATDKDALMKHLEANLPMAALGKVQAMLGIEL